MTELFEDNQRDLERAVENLGYSLEQNIGDTGSIAKLRQDITNQSVSGMLGSPTQSTLLGTVRLVPPADTCQAYVQR
jgi:hypothetical protein